MGKRAEHCAKRTKSGGASLKLAALNERVSPPPNHVRAYECMPHQPLGDGRLQAFMRTVGDQPQALRATLHQHREDWRDFLPFSVLLPTAKKPINPVNLLTKVANPTIIFLLSFTYFQQLSTITHLDHLQPPSIAIGDAPKAAWSASAGVGGCIGCIRRHHSKRSQCS